MEKIVIIADDLTGACDTGIKFKNFGWDTQVLVSTAGCKNLLRSATPVVSVNTDTRSASPEEAFEIVVSTLRSIQAQTEFFCYKKVDSVLRGNIASEIEACFQALGTQFAIITPAFPKANRRVQDGQLYIGPEDVPEAVVDAKSSITAGSQRICRLLTLDTIRQGLDAVLEQIEQLTQEGATLILADSWCSKDLHTVAQAVLHFGNRCTPVGSAGLASHLADLLREEDISSTTQTSKPSFREGPLMVVVGTQHPTTVEQIQRLKEEEPLDTYLLTVDGICQENVAQRVDSLLEGGQSQTKAQGILLTTDRIYNSTVINRQLLQKNAYNRSILDGIGLSVEKLLLKTPIRGMIASGGDVSSEILGRLHVSHIDLVDEPIPGIVIGDAASEDSGHILIATKSGGFGNQDALLDLFRYMNTYNIHKE